MDLFSGRLIGPQRLLFSSDIVCDHAVRRIQNILRTAVILLQLNDLRVRKILLKIEDISDIRTPKFVDRLIIVTDHTQIAVFARQQTDQFKLRRIRVLILVHHDIFEPFLIIVEHLHIRLEQLHRLHDEVIKIHRVILFQYGLILAVHLCLTLSCIIAGGIQCKLRRIREVVLRGGDHI